MSSSSPSTPSPSRKRPVVKSELDNSASPNPSPNKKPRGVTTAGKTKNDAWTSQDRLQLFEAYQACAQVKWDDVAAKMGGGKNATACRDQWNRATGKKIKKALGEKE